jgi:hypothetical protein
VGHRRWCIITFVGEKQCMVENRRVVTIVDCVRSCAGSLTYARRQEANCFLLQSQSGALRVYSLHDSSPESKDDGN